MFLNPEGPSTQYLRSLVPKTIPLMAFGIKILKYWEITWTLRGRHSTTDPGCSKEREVHRVHKRTASKVVCWWIHAGSGRSTTLKIHRLYGRVAFTGALGILLVFSRKSAVARQPKSCSPRCLGTAADRVIKTDREGQFAELHLERILQEPSIRNFRNQPIEGPKQLGRHMSHSQNSLYTV